MPEPRPPLGRVLGLLALSLGLGAQPAPPTWSLTGYLQQSWPKQTETNRQIKQDINETFGTHFRSWDDVANLNVGVIALRTVAPAWKVGLEFDYSRGRIRGAETVADFGLGPGSLSFEQRYDTFADLLAMVQYRPFGGGGRLVPFASGGVGMAYEKDTTTLAFTPSVGGGELNLLRVENHGWFPMLTLGVGLDAYLTPRRDWFLEVGASYTWARLKRDATASGVLAPGPTVRADTDSTGPNLLFGLGRRF